MNIPKLKEYYFQDGKFYLRNKFVKSFKRSLVVGFFIGGIFAAQVTSSHLAPQQGAVTYGEVESRLIGYVKTSNSDLSHSDATQIVKSTLKWASEFNIEPTMLLAIQKVESGYNKHSISKAGALGVMQVIPGWHINKISKAKEVLDTPEIFNINTNIYLGTWVLNECTRKFNLIKNSLLCYNGSNAKPNGYDTKVLSVKTEIDRIIKYDK